jgi:hypothetical protein
MTPCRYVPGRAGDVAGAGIEYSVQRFGTANRSPAQPADLLLGIRLRGFRPLARGALIGFADLELPSGLALFECPIFRAKDGNAWVALPSKPVVDRNGKQQTDINGKRQFAPVLEWRSRELANQVSAAVVALIERAYPGALDGGEL